MNETRPATTSSGTPVRPSSGTPDPAQKPKLLDRLREALRSRHYSRRTEQTYCHWIKRFVFFHNIRDGKGAKDRITMLPESLKTPLQGTIRKRDCSERSRQGPIVP